MDVFSPTCKTALPIVLVIKRMVPVPVTLSRKTKTYFPRLQTLLSIPENKINFLNKNYSKPKRTKSNIPILERSFGFTKSVNHFNSTKKTLKGTKKHNCFLANPDGVQVINFRRLSCFRPCCMEKDAQHKP